MSALKSDPPDFIFNLESSKSLVVENFTYFPVVESKVRVNQMSEPSKGKEQYEVWIVSLALLFKRL